MVCPVYDICVSVVDNMATPGEYFLLYLTPFPI
jgi:hypothetical protein